MKPNWTLSCVEWGCLAGASFFTLRSFLRRPLLKHNAIAGLAVALLNPSGFLVSAFRGLGVDVHF